MILKVCSDRETAKRTARWEQKGNGCYFSDEARFMPPIERMIQSLQLVQKQKESYVFPLDVASLENYLNGFRAACAACGHEVPRKLRAKIIESRGWKAVAAGPAPQMKAKGMSEDAVMQELIEIEVEQLRQLAKQAAPAAVKDATPAAKPTAPPPRDGPTESPSSGWRRWFGS